MTASYDKYLTRLAQRGPCTVLMYGRRWYLEKGETYSIRFNRADPAKSYVVRLVRMVEEGQGES